MFACLIEICLLFAYVVLTVTVRHEFRDVRCFGMVWMFILAYFLFYVRTGFTFVLEFQKLVFDCETYLQDRGDKDADKDQDSLEERPNLTNLTNEHYAVNWVPAIGMLILAEVLNLAKWGGNCYWYMPLLIFNGLCICYHTFKLKRYYAKPTQVEVYSFEEKLERIAQAEKEVKSKLNEVLKKPT